MYRIAAPALVLLLTGVASAQPPPPAEVVRIGSVWDFIVKGGPVMIPIGLVSLVALAVIIERLLTLRRAVVIPTAFLPGLQAALGDGRGDRRAALAYCASHDCSLARILAAGVKSLGEPLELLEKHIEEAGQREVRKLRKYLRLLSLISSVATLLGLLGTILGLITAFQTVAVSGEALGKTELLAKGIYEAMITTAAGLIVAIPVIIAYHGLSARIEGLVAEMDQLTVGFVEQHARGGDAPRQPAALSPAASDASPEPVGQVAAA